MIHRLVPSLLIGFTLFACRNTPVDAPSSPALVASPVLSASPEDTRESAAWLEPYLDQDAPAPAAVAPGQADAVVLPHGRFGDKWVFSVAPYVWFLGIDGDARIDGSPVELDIDFGDIWDDLQFVLEGRIAAVKGDWGVKFDGTYALLESDAASGMAEVDVDTTMGLYFLAGTYKLYEDELKGNDQVRVDGVLGFLSTDMEVDLDSNVPALDGLSGDQSWLDLFVGVDAAWQINQRNLVRAGLILGGWELLGDSSDSVWGVELGYGYSFGKMLHWTAYAGYRWLGIDYDPGNSFAFDATIFGPLVGISYAW